jgi:hypothetical protein
VSTQPVKHLFVHAVNSDQSLRVELNQWSGGEWEKINPTMSLGQPAVFQERLKEFSYDAVPVLLDSSAVWEERIVSRQGNIGYNTRQTTGIVFIRTDGQIEEHLLLEDIKKRRDFANELAAIKEVRQAITPTGGGRDLGRPPLRGPARGGGRFEDF